MIEREDCDPAETREWLDALDSLEAFEGVGRVDELLEGVIQVARRKGAKLSFAAGALAPGTGRWSSTNVALGSCRRNDPIFRVSPLASFPERQTDPGGSHWRGGDGVPGNLKQNE